jgi:hypothetical protein
VADAVTEDVVLTAYCQRRKHKVLTVIDRDGVLYGEADRIAVGPKRSSWTPGSWQMVAGRWRRVGCACGQSWHVGVEDIVRWRAAGYTKVLLPPSRIGPIGPVRLGAN